MNIDKLSGGFIALFGLLLIYLVIPAQVEMVESDSLTPRTFPLIIAWLLVGVGAIQALIANRPQRYSVSGLGRVLLLVGFFVATIYLASLSRFIYISPLFALVLMVFMREKRPLWLLLGSLVTPLTIWLCVEVLLGRELI
jgi:hypothetical protein